MRTLKYILAIVLLILIISCEKESFNFSQTKSKVLFISRRIENSNKWNLLTMNGDGTEQVKITDLTVGCEKPVISHSGEIVLFVHYTEDFNYELYSMSINGSNLTLIDRTDRYCGSADWSSDDTKIIYSKNRNESTDEKDIILYNFNTGEKTTLTSLMNNYSAKFSPLNQIVYCRQNDNTSDIYLMNIDGSDNHLIISDAWCPIWSPEGNKIAYLSNGELNSPQIFVANADGSSSKQLTTADLPSWDSGFPTFGNYNPQWTSDGNKIVYESEIDDGLPEIYIMNSDGRNQKRLTNTERRNECPVISSDGKFILFSSNRNLNYNSEIFVMDIDGNNQNSLTKYLGDDCFPEVVKE